MSKHTAGPWEFNKELNLIRDTVTRVTICENVAPMPFKRALWTPEHEANARLIASAPMLLSALQNLVGEGAQHEVTCDQSEHDEDSACIYCEARAAIAKAEGKEG